jgi:hypothetical protein
MLNPTLGRNLGRWAHVYFTSPPEKREQAVLELLRELEAESGSPGTPESGVPLNGNSTIPKTEGRMTPETVLCAECGHLNAKPQRFCGMCGSSLTLDDASARSGTEPIPSTISGRMAKELPSDAPHQPVFPTLSLFAQAAEDTSSSSTRRNSEIHWLRDRDFEEETATSPALKYVLVVLAIVLAGAFFYSRSRTQVTRSPGEQGPSGVWTGGGGAPPPARSPSSSPAPTTADEANSKKLDSTPAATAPAATSNSATAQEPTPAEPNPQSAPQTTTPARAANSGTKQPTVTPVSESQHLATAPRESGGAAMNGSVELATAEEFLTGKRGPRNSAVAATFLWKAVSKENTTAALLLSDLYRTGDGVPKSCDQARLLLYAAARKNVPEAGRKLRALQGGCQ